MSTIEEEHTVELAHMSLITLFYIFVAALLTALIMIPPISNLAVRVGGVDRPDERKIHLKDTPRLGGIAIFSAFLFSVMFFVDIDRQTKGFLAGAVLIFLTGLADDLTNLKPVHKLLGQFLAAVTAVVSGGIVMTTLGYPLGFFEIKLGIFAIPFTVFAVVGVMNAINLIDGLDGLAGGVSAIACLALAALSWKAGNLHLLTLVVAILGSIVGFLRYNTYPAKIFMGDSGSLFLGYCMGFCSVLLLTESRGSISPVAPLFILGIPILDTLVVMGRRIKRGKNIASPDKTHIHHRLLELGFGHKFTVLLVYGLSYLLSVVAVVFYNAPDYLLAASLITFFIIFYTVLNSLTHTVWQQDITFFQSNQSLRETQTYRRIVGLSHYVLLAVKYLLILILGLAAFIPPLYPTAVPLMASLLMVLTLALFIFERQWANSLLQVVIYFSGALIIFFIENFGQTAFYFGCSLVSVSHIVFAMLFLFEGIKIILRKRTSKLISSPFEYFILFTLISVTLVPTEFTNRYHLFTVTAKSVVMFFAYKLILMRQARNNRKILLATFAALLVMVARYMVEK